MNRLPIAFAITCFSLFLGCNSERDFPSDQASLQVRYEILDAHYLMLSNQLHIRHFNWSPVAAYQEFERAEQAAQRVTINDLDAIEILERPNMLYLELFQVKAAINAELEEQQTARALAFKKDLDDDQMFQEYLKVKQQLDELSGS